MDIWIVVVAVALSVGGSGRRSICILERLNQVSRFPGPGSRERLDSDPSRQLCVRHRPKHETRRDETKDRHTAHKKWDLCGVSFRQRENVMRFYDFISDNRPWNLMDTTWGSLVGCSAPHSHSHFNFFVWQTNLSLFFVHFLEFSCIFLALDEQQQQQPQNESCTQTNQKFCVPETNRGKMSSETCVTSTHRWCIWGCLLIKSCMV